MEPDGILALFKFGKREHIDQFVHEGHIYMNSLNYFRTLEDDMLRADKHEGASYNLQADGAILQMEQSEKWVDVAKIKEQLVWSDGSKDVTNVFCMYAFRESASKNFIDPRNFGLGDAFAMITAKDGDEFFRRINVAAKKENIVLEQELVEYVNKATYDGTMGVFRKFSNFAYQSEFRLSVVTGKDTPFSFRIGDISDISTIGTVAELNKRIKITPK
jgi:hypothetical protein